VCFSWGLGNLFKDRPEHRPVCEHRTQTRRTQSPRIDQLALGRRLDTTERRKKKKKPSARAAGKKDWWKKRVLLERLGVTKKQCLAKDNDPCSKEKRRSSSGKYGQKKEEKNLSRRYHDQTITTA